MKKKEAIARILVLSVFLLTVKTYTQPEETQENTTEEKTLEASQSSQSEKKNASNSKSSDNEPNAKKETNGEQKTKSVVEADISGPDTNSYPEEKIGSHGNWIKKKEWWKHTKELSFQIADVIKEIAEIRKDFTQKYVAIGDQHYDFYQEFGFEQGKLEDLFASINKYLEKQRKRKVEEFTEKTREGVLKKRDLQNNIDLIDEKIKLFKTQLEQLKLDLQSIEELDKSLLERLNKVDEHIAQVNQDSAKVDEIKKTMLYVVDHNKARELYHKLKNEILAKLETIKTYLSDTLMKDFEKVSSTITSQIEKTKTTIKKLEEKKLIIKNRALRIATIKEEKQQHEEELKTEIEQAKKTVRNVVKKETDDPSWISSLYDIITSVVAGIITPVRDLIYGSPPPPKKIKQKPSIQSDDTSQKKSEETLSKKDETPVK